MRLSSSRLLAYARTTEVGKKLRYAGLSVVFVPIGQGLIQVLGLWLDNYTTASLLAVAILAIPGFFANKHFVWRVTSRENLRNQVLMFWAVMMLGVSLATVFTYLAEAMMADQTVLVRGATALFAQLLGLGIVWVGRFLILDRWFFRALPDTSDHAAAAIDGMSAS
jgi:putative flippase GtrA